MIAVIDYGLGNLFSLKSSLDYIGLDNILTSDKDVIRNADAIILPGVGAFRDAISKLKEDGLYELLIEQANSGKPFLGICLGMQLLFEKSYEYGEYEGLGLINGEIRSIEEDIDESLKNLKIPHMGWNSVEFNGKHPITTGQKQPAWFYFVHSYYVEPADQSLVVGRSEYGTPSAAAIASGNLFACQFHPEKSQSAGLSLIKRFGELSCV